jgi:soluble lytic murein transglycosylase
VASAPASPAAVALQLARERLIDGDYRRAMEDFERLQRDHPGTSEAAEALYHYGEAALADDNFPVAEDALRRFLAGNPDHPGRPVALLLLGRTLEGRKDGAGATAVYQQYVEAGRSGGDAAPVADVVHLRLAAIAFGDGRVADGWAELGEAAGAAERSGSATARARVYETLGQRYLEAGDRGKAIGALQAALDAAVAAHRPDRSVAETAWKLVGAYREAGRQDLADSLRWRIVGEWPRTPVAQSALNDLGPSAVPASVRGLIAYSNSRWAQAVEAYTAYLAAGAPEGNVDEARYQRAVALTRLGAGEALDALDEVAALHAQSPRAADALWEAGSLLLRRGDHPAALARFERLAVGYPDSPRRGQALYWLGKLLPELGDPAAGHRYMEAAAAGGYEDYYTFRARAALRHPAPAPKPLEDQASISEEERDAWRRWLAAHGRTLDDQAERRAQVEADPRYRRGIVLLEAGMRREAEEELRELLEAYQNDPVAVEHVAVQVRDRGFFPFSMTLGQRLLEAGYGTGETSLLAAPRVVQKLVLPLAFLDLVVPAARQNGVDPLLLLGMMKQESYFEPRAQSSASARGLTQFVYGTARAVADELEWPNWTWDDMNHPYVSVPFGAHYLSDLVQRFRGNYLFALAGYNGGPGNVLRWAKGDWNRDVDLFVEEIGYFETRGYVKAVSGNYELYRGIYYR